MESVLREAGYDTELCKLDLEAVITEIVTESLPLDLSTDEECTPVSQLLEQATLCQHAATTIDRLIVSSPQSIITTSPPPHLLLFIAGCLGDPVLDAPFHTSDLRRAVGDLLITSLKYFSDCKSPTDWLTSSATSCPCKPTLELASVKLRSCSSLKCVPFYRDACLWILRHLHYPHLSDHLETLLPLSLRIVDDYRVDMKLAGIEALRHILRHSLKAEMRYSGQASVIITALKTLLYSRDPGILEVIYPCLVELIETLPSSECCYDEIFDRLLTDIKQESRLEHKLVLVSHLDLLVGVMGVSTVQHIRRYLGAMEHILLSPDYPDWSIRRAALANIALFLPAVWPLMSEFLSDLLTITVAFLDECGEIPDPAKDDLVKVVQLLALYDHHLVYSVLLSAGGELENEAFITHLAGILTKGE